MMAFCPKCGSEMADDDVFCRSCGAQIEPLENKNKSKEEKSDLKSSTEEDKSKEASDFKSNILTKEENDNKLLLIPLVLGIIGVLIGIAEGLGCPMLFGWENIITELIIVAVGGCMALFLYFFKKEYFIAGIEFIVTGIMMVFLIGYMAMYGAIMLIIAGILAIVLTKKFNADNNLFYTFPVATVCLVFIILMLFIASGIANLNELSDSVTVSNVNNSIEYSYGYYDGYVKGDITFNKSVEDLSMEMQFFDKNGKVLDKTYPLSENNIQAGKTYQFEGLYMKEEQPYKAEIILKNGFEDDSVFYMQNITLA